MWHKYWTKPYGRNLILKYKLPKKKEIFESFSNANQGQQIDSADDSEDGSATGLIASNILLGLYLFL